MRTILGRVNGPGGRRGGRRWATIPLVAGALVAVLAQLPGSAASATPVQDQGEVGPVQGGGGEDGGDDGGGATGVRIDVEAGLGGLVRSGGAVPVRVTIQADRLIQGTVQASFSQWGNNWGTVERAVEVSGGSVAEVWLLGPGGQNMSEGLSLNVRLRSGGETLTQASSEVKAEPQAETVGVMPDVDPPVADLAETVLLQVDLGEARLGAVDGELLALGALALSSLDQLVVTPAELAGLPETTQQSVMLWVARGGHLVLAGDDTSPAEAVLPDGWLPEEDHGVRAGLGRVRMVDGRWHEKLLPTPTSSVDEEQETALFDLPPQQHSVIGRLGQDAGVQLPEGRRLAFLLGGYVLVIGPVLFITLFLVRRRHLAWVAVPLVAVLATTGMFVTGASVRRSQQASHVVVYETGPAGTMATTWSLVGRASRGDAGVRLQRGWTAQPPSDGEWLGETAAPVRVLDDGGIEASVGTDAGGYQLIQSFGEVSGMDEALVVTARAADDDRVTGTVRNLMDVPVHDVAVFVGRSAATRVGTLGPEEEREFTVEKVTTGDFGSSMESEVWPSARWDEDLVVPAAWTGVMWDNGWNFRPLGQAVAVGWTDELEAPVEPTSGSGATARTTSAIVARAGIAPDGDRLESPATIGTVTRGSQSTRAGVPDAEELVFASSTELPARVGDRALDRSRLQLSPEVEWYTTLEVWAPGGWVPREDLPAAADGGFLLPDGAMVDGRVFVRVSMPLAPPPPGTYISFYEGER